MKRKKKMMKRMRKRKMTAVVLAVRRAESTRTLKIILLTQLKQRLLVITEAAAQAQCAVRQNGKGVAGWFL